MEIATGQPVHSPLNGQSGWSCRSDDQALTICSLAPYVGTDAVLGFDATGAELWRVTRDSGRVPPTVTTAWHGMVYGYTDAGPLVLDGRTGQDRITSAATAPLLVNEYFAVGADTPATPDQRPNYRRPSRLVATPLPDEWAGQGRSVRSVGPDACMTRRSATTCSSARRVAGRR